MKKFVFSKSTWLLMFGVLLIQGLQAQECPGSVWLNTQAAVNSFNCTEIGGDLSIWGDDITDLSPLSALTHVEGRLIIYYTSALETVDGFQNLTSVGGALIFESNHALTGISGFDNLVSIGGDLEIRFHDDLLSLSGFQNLTSVGGWFALEGNTALTTFDAFQNLATIGQTIVIYNNTLLTNLDGLQSLTSVGVSFWFQGNSSLSDLEGLHNLQQVGNVLAIYSTLTTNLDGLRNLTSVGEFYISDNVYLTNLDGLQNLTYVDVQFLIWENPVLDSFCGLHDYLTDPQNPYYAWDNAENPTREEILGDGPCNTAPEAVCQDLTLAADENCQAEVSASAIDNGSSDPDGDEITLSISPEGPYELGATTVTLTVTDEYGATDQCTAVITVNDETTPVIVANPEEDDFILWPPNHDYVTFLVSDLAMSVSDNCSSLSTDDVYISYATSDEPEDVKGNGDGNTLDDIVISSDCQSVQLRQERQGNGNGRVYTIHLEVADAAGNTGTAICKAYVPHNNGETAVDDGVAYTEECGVKSAPVISNYSSGELTIYPSPFSGTATVEFRVEESNYARLAVYNSMGMEVEVLFEGPAQSDQVYQLKLDGSSLPGGVYFCRLQSGKDVRMIRKMVVME